MPLSVLSLVLLARTPAGSTSLALAPLLRHEHAILVRVGPYRDGKHDPTSPQCVEAITLSMQPEGGMRAVDKPPVDSSGSSAEPAFTTTGSREFLLPIRSPASRFKGRVQPEVPAACREGPWSTECASARRGFSGATRRLHSHICHPKRSPGPHGASVLGGPHDWLTAALGHGRLWPPGIILQSLPYSASPPTAR